MCISLYVKTRNLEVGVRKWAILVYKDVKSTLEEARSKSYSAINLYMVKAYWSIGKLIVEAQNGEEKAEYGEFLIKNLSKELTKDFGKGFTASNLRNIRQFYLTFNNCYALRSELSRTYYIEFLDLKENKKFLEKDLEQGLINNLQEFLLELGKGFSFVGRQRRITVGNKDYYIDLLFHSTKKIG